MHDKRQISGILNRVRGMSRAAWGAVMRREGDAATVPASLCLSFAVSLLPLLLSLGTDARQSGQSPIGQGVDPLQFVGSEMCQRCHREVFIPWEQTAHRLTDWQVGRRLDEKGCEACHGPGRKHVEGGDKRNIFSFKRALPKVVNAVCLKCHGRDEDRVRFRRSEHSLAAMACTDCHEPHPNFITVTESLRQRPMGLQAPAANGRLLRQGVPRLCFSCHREIEAQFALPVRHRVSEGVIQCNDCHNQHGSVTEPQLRGLKNDKTRICLSCHTEKAGPFAFEHAPVKIEGCTICHTPHGSITKHLLKRREGRFLCLECHALPQATNVPHGRLGFLGGGECVRCHTQIHGSNFSPFFLQ